MPNSSPYPSLSWANSLSRLEFREKAASFRAVAGSCGPAAWVRLAPLALPPLFLSTSFNLTRVMPKFFTYLRLLALAMSFALTSCFDHDKKCDPKPSTAKCGTTATPSGGAS